MERNVNFKNTEKKNYGKKKKENLKGNKQPNEMNKQMDTETTILYNNHMPIKINL